MLFFCRASSRDENISPGGLKQRKFDCKFPKLSFLQPLLTPTHSQILLRWLDPSWSYVSHIKTTSVADTKYFIFRCPRPPRGPSDSDSHSSTGHPSLILPPPLGRHFVQFLILIADQPLQNSCSEEIKLALGTSLGKFPLAITYRLTQGIDLRIKLISSALAFSFV